MWKPGRAHSAPLEIFARTQKRSGKGEGKEPGTYSVAKRTPRIAPVVSLFQICAGGNQSAFRKTTDLATAFFLGGFGWGKEGAEGKGGRRSGEEYSQLILRT